MGAKVSVFTISDWLGTRTDRGFNEEPGAIEGLAAVQDAAAGFLDRGNGI